MLARSNDEARLRVCMVTGYRPTPGGGGMEKHVYELASGLLERNVDVEIICEDRSFLPDHSHAFEDRILGVSPQSLRSLGWTELYREKSRRFAEMLHPERYDVVHCHSHYGFDAALKLSRLSYRPALVTTYHLTPVGQLERLRQLGIPEPDGAPIDRAVARMEATAARLSDRCIAVSRSVGREIVRFYRVPRGRVSVVHNWYDSRNFGPCDSKRARRLLGLDVDATYLLYIGHFELHQGQLLAEVMRRLRPEIKLLAVHPTADRSIQAEFGDRIRFVGYNRPERLALYYAASDLQCFPAVYSGFGLVLIEGMACGCPPVVFNFPAMNEIVTSECGYLVNEPSPDAYAAAILCGLRDGGSKRRAAVCRAGQFRMAPQIDRVLDIYEEARGSANEAARGRRSGRYAHRREWPLIYASGRRS